MDVEKQKELTELKELERIEKMHVPPAYQNVMIHKNPRHKIQAYGYDARGRKQVMYAPWFVHKQAQKKYDKVVDMDGYMPQLMERMKKDIARPRNSKSKMVAVVLYLMIACGFRIGNDKYAAQNSSYGLTTLEVRHVTVKRTEGAIYFQFIGKKGVENHGKVLESDAPLVFKYIRKCIAKKAKTDRIFEGVSSEDVNNYLREVHPDMTSKDVRTWNANQMFLSHIMNAQRDTTVASAERIVNKAIDKVANHLHHTRAVCKNNYIHPDFLNFAHIVMVQRQT